MPTVNPLAIPAHATPKEVEDSSPFTLVFKESFKIGGISQKSPCYIVQLKDGWKLKDLNLSPTVLTYLNTQEISLEEGVRASRQKTAVIDGEDSLFRSNCGDRKIIESWIVAIWGTGQTLMCKQCEESKFKAEKDWPVPYLKCRTIDGLFGGACSNCKRQDKGVLCSLTKANIEKDTQERQADAAKEVKAHDRAARLQKRADRAA